MRKVVKRKSVAQRIRAGMKELETAMRSNKPLDELFTVRTVEVPQPSTYDAASVRSVRERLRVSQRIFAQLLGVSVELVEHWEQGLSAPRGPVRRLLDEINRQPEDFLRRHVGPASRERVRRAG